MVKIFFVSLSILILGQANSYSQENIDVMVSCAEKNPDGMVMTTTEFVEGLNTDEFLGKDSVKLLNEIKLPQSTSVLGSTELYETSKVHMVRISTDKLKKYVEKMNKSNPYPDITPPKNTLEVLEDFQMMTAGACDFIVPTRFKIMTAVKGEESKEVKTLKENLSKCQAEVEEFKSKGAGVNDSLRNDVKNIEKKIIEKKGSSVKGTKQ